jgi:Ras-related protein Rab-8A
MKAMEDKQRNAPIGLQMTNPRERTREPLALNRQSEGALVPRERDKSAAGAVKVILAGDGAVGKTTLVRRLCTDQFDSRRAITIGVEFHIHDVPHDSSRTRLIVWDVGGQEQFAFTRRAFYRGGKAVGLVYSTSDRRSFERLAQWRSEINQMLPNAPVVLAGNKNDLPRQVTLEEGRALAAEWHIPFFETSCCSGLGVKEFFQAVAQAAVGSRPASVH